MKLWCPKKKGELWWDYIEASERAALAALASYLYGNVPLAAVPKAMKKEGFSIVPVSLREIKPKRKAKR